MEKLNYKSVLFCCMGNIIRSPLCEGLFKNIMGDDYIVDSCAVTEDDLGVSPEENSCIIAKREGFDISNHISRLITKKDFYNFDLIVGLDQWVTNELKNMKPKDSSSLVVDLIPKKSVLNPYKQPLKNFEQMYEQIKPGMINFIKTYFPEHEFHKK